MLRYCDAKHPGGGDNFVTLARAEKEAISPRKGGPQGKGQENTVLQFSRCSVLARVVIMDWGLQASPW